MLQKQSNEEKAWYWFHDDRGKGLIVGEQWMYNKMSFEQYLNQPVKLTP